MYEVLYYQRSISKVCAIQTVTHLWCRIAWPETCRCLEGIGKVFSICIATQATHLQLQRRALCVTDRCRHSA